LTVVVEVTENAPPYVLPLVVLGSLPSVV